MVVTVRAYILVETAIGKEYEVAEAIAKLASEGLRVSVDVVYGEYDVVVLVDAVSLELLDRVVSTIRRIPGVVRTKTLIASESR